MMKVLDTVRNQNVVQREPSLVKYGSMLFLVGQKIHVSHKPRDLISTKAFQLELRLGTDRASVRIQIAP